MSERERGVPYKVPGLMNPRRMVTAMDCTGCGKQIRMGSHSAKSARRVLDLFGTLCAECQETA